MIFEKFKNIKAVVLDVDGVLTDGTIQVNENGDHLRTFFVKDGYAMQLAQKRGLMLWVISGGSSEGVRLRLDRLGITEIHTGIANKTQILEELLAKYSLNENEIMYIGDDMPDYHVMQNVGVAVCPVDACEDIKKIADYMSPKKGGRGVVRDVLEKVLKIQGKWDDDSLVKSV